jgi:hypothetical protein
MDNTVANVNVVVAPSGFPITVGYLTSNGDRARGHGLPGHGPVTLTFRRVCRPPARVPITIWVGCPGRSRTSSST